MNLRSLSVAFLGGTLFVHGTNAAVPQPAGNPANQSAILTLLSREASRLDAAFLAGITNRSQWAARRPQLRQEYFEMLGLWPLPERTPLMAKITGTLQRDEGFRVENLHFQSRPGLYVTGNLYLPREAKAGAKLPAVLYVCGHSGRGRDGNKTAFQHHGMWFATHGYVCLIIDTLQLGEIAAIHHGTYRENRWWWQARGYTSASVECWNGIRALDYLQSRQEVDAERLAVTGISGGGAATFWIAAADERVKVAVPVSGMSDLQDYVGEKVINGHCDCMFLINTFQWPWTQIAALVAPRPLLFANSGHDTIFPMPGNDRIRTRLETLYGFYTNRTDRLFDIGVTPGGHDDKPELRLMAYRWINRFLKNDDSPVTEPDLPKIEARLLRAFPGDLPSDQLNTKIDEVFVPMAGGALPQSAQEFQAWRETKSNELRRLVFRSLPKQDAAAAPMKLSRSVNVGTFANEHGFGIAWKYFPPATSNRGVPTWIVVLGEKDSIDVRPEWLPKQTARDAVFLISPRNSASFPWADPPPYYIRRSLPLLGRTAETDQLADVLAFANAVLADKRNSSVKILGRGTAGILAAYAALLEPRIAEVMLVEPTTSHRDGPIFLNVLRVVDIPEALGMLAPRPLRIATGQPNAFKSTADLYGVAGAKLNLEPR